MAKWASDKKKDQSNAAAKPVSYFPPRAEFEVHRPVDDFFSDYETITLKALGTCVFCPRKFDKEAEFRDEIARREYLISRLCQQCQDKCFAS